MMVGERYKGIVAVHKDKKVFKQDAILVSDEYDTLYV